MRRARIGLGILLVVGAASASSSAASETATGRALEPGFLVTPFVATGGTPSSLTFGPDTRKGQKGARLYIADYVSGEILVVDDVGGVGTAPQVFANGFSGPLGVVAGKDGTVYVADSESARQGPFGFRAYGRVWRVSDRDGDGTADKQKVVLEDLPNGRHNTNGMAFGPDGLLYITNGNSTDDGVEGGEAEVVPWSGSVVRIDPKMNKASLADLPVRKTLVASGWRNVYDVAFSPVNPSLLFVPMNGTDDARQGSTGGNPVDPELEDSDDLLYATDVADRRIDDFGFPSCLYNIARTGRLKPYDNPNPDVIDLFGRCPRNVARPLSSFGLHTSADGLAFQTTDRWGDDYRNDLFVTEWGSLFGPPRGHDVIRVQLDRSGRKVVSQSVFLVLDLPIDVTFDANGVMYVADFSGQIVRIDKVI